MQKLWVRFINHYLFSFKHNNHFSSFESGGIFQGQITRLVNRTKCDIIGFYKPQILAVTLVYDSAC